MSTARVDFLRVAPQPLWGWMLLAIGVALLAVSLGLRQRWAGQDAQWQAQQQTRQMAQERARRQAESSVLSRPRQERLEHLLNALNRPWLPVLNAMEEAAQDPVYLLSLSIDAEAGQLQLDGESPSFDHALAYVQRLDLNPALEPAQIVSHELVNDPTAARSFVRFTATTHWRAP